VSWTPASGAESLVSRVGRDVAVERLIVLLRGGLDPAELAWPPYREVLLDIGDGHAQRLLTDESGERLDYWPRVWAARALAYVGSEAEGPALVGSLTDSHWRVRMTGAQTLGRLRIEGVTPNLLAALADDHHRVRGAVLVSLGRVGDASALSQLVAELETDPGNLAVERAMLLISLRLD
jgi:HEAT repeat protein